MKILQDKPSVTALILPKFRFIQSMTWGLIGVCFITLSACQSQSSNSDETNPETVEDSIEEQVILENATVDQVNSEGKTLWKLDVKKVVYDKNSKAANLEQVKGELYQNGEAFFEIEANQGKIINDGEKVKLQGEVVATDKRNDTVFRSEQINWLPEDNLIVMPASIEGKNPQFNGSADEGKYHTKKQELELTGNVKGTSNDPALELTGEQIKWLISDKLVQSNRNLKIKHYQAGSETVKEQVTANSGKLDLAQNIISLTDNVKFESIDPAVEVTSNDMNWDIQKQLVRSNQPFKLVHLEDNITLTGNQGDINLETKIAQVNGNVEAVNQANQAKLAANRLRWNLPTQNMEAQGNVVYEQRKPSINSRGEQATGNLQTENITVQGKQGEQVTTEFIP